MNSLCLFSFLFVLNMFIVCCFGLFSVLLFLLSSASSKPLVLLVLIISSSIHSPSLQNQHSHTLSVTHTLTVPANSAAHVQNHFIFQLNLSMQNKLCVCVYKSASSSESEHSPKAETTPSITIPISSDLCHSLSLNRPANDCTFSSNIPPHLSSNTLQNFIVQIVLASIWEKKFYIYIKYLFILIFKIIYIFIFMYIILITTKMNFHLWLGYSEACNVNVKILIISPVLQYAC